MSHAKGQCPICKLDKQYVQTTDHGERLSLQCERCGAFTITRTAAHMAEKRRLGAKFSAWIRERTDSGAEPPVISSNTLEDLASTFPTYRVADKQLLLLRALERRSKFPGDPVSVVDEHDYPWAWAEGAEEFKYLLRSLIERGLLRRVDGPADLQDSFQFMIEITANGWAFLEQHARPSVISNQAFVAMSFAPALKSAWESGIRAALTRARFSPYRVDVQPHNERIDAKIITEIKNSRFVVADVTQQRPGVYYEAGYAAGLGIPVIWSVREDDLKNVHFDTRQYNHIVWSDENDLAEQLFFHVSAIIGNGTAT